MKLYAGVSEGYVYVISVLGTTGERSAVAPRVAEIVERARKCFDLPLAMGFGFSSPDQLGVLPESGQPDAVVFGSALVHFLRDGHSAEEFMQRWEGAKSRRIHNA